MECRNLSKYTSCGLSPCTVVHHFIAFSLEREMIKTRSSQHVMCCNVWWWDVMLPHDNVTRNVGRCDNCFPRLRTRRSARDAAITIGKFHPSSWSGPNGWGALQENLTLWQLHYLAKEKNLERTFMPYHVLDSQKVLKILFIICYPFLLKITSM